MEGYTGEWLEFPDIGKRVWIVHMDKVPEQSPEVKAAYQRGCRRGYRDGWIAAAEAAYQRGLTAGGYNQLFAFWEKTLFWWRGAADFPPAMPLPKGKEKRR